MKASINFRDDRQPLVRAKVPISVLGLPFLSGVSASGDDARDLRLDLATAFESGPSVRLSYRPNDASNSFSLTLKSGAGPFGSPLRAPFSISAEFNLVGAGARYGSPSFSLLFKPRLGDFSVRKIVRSTTSVSGAVVAASKVAPAVDADQEGLVNAVETPAVEFQLQNGIQIVEKIDGFPIHVNTIAAHCSSGEGTDGLLSGFQVTTRSVLPLRNRATVNFKWGVRVPAELRNGFHSQGACFSLSKLPLLVMNKISVEQIADDQKVKDKKVDASASYGMEACGSVRWHLESLQAENSLLRKAVEELRSEVTAWKFASPNLGTGDASKGGGGKMVAEKRDQSDGRSAEVSRKATSSEDLSEELKKALAAASSAQRF